jgi:hypothetical protein
MLEDRSSYTREHSRAPTPRQAGNRIPRHSATQWRDRQTSLAQEYQLERSNRSWITCYSSRETSSSSPRPHSQNLNAIMNFRENHHSSHRVSVSISSAPSYRPGLRPGLRPQDYLSLVIGFSNLITSVWSSTSHHFSSHQRRQRVRDSSSKSPSQKSGHRLFKIQPGHRLLKISAERPTVGFSTSQRRRSVPDSSLQSIHLETTSYQSSHHQNPRRSGPGADTGVTNLSA